MADEPRTAFQSGRAWMEEIAVPVNTAFVYSSDAERIKSWRDKGYITWVMLGASWLSKKTDVVVEHPEIKQTTSNGVPFEMIPGRAWVVPVKPWIDWFIGRTDEALAGGARAILPEEPEFFASTGYSDSFKTAWKEYYGEDWRPPHETFENYWRAGQLKAHLFEEFFRQVCSHVKGKDRSVMCIVPAHSNLNYTDWNIVAPHHAFFALDDVDGFIAQVWTGTAKHPHMLGGEPFAGVFDYGFLEYSYFAELVRGTDKQAWFLTDPVEDAPGADWSDLRAWYEDTLTAALLQPAVNRYEVTPWPSRVFLTDDLYGGSRIPDDYRQELYSIWKAQAEIPAGGVWREPLNTEIGFLTSDTAMWQKGKGNNRFGGHVAPMLAAVRSGIAARVLPAERFLEPGYPPQDLKVVVASFDAWKPVKREMVSSIAEWVKGGGTLLYTGGWDEYDEMPSSWWRTAGFKTPALALLSELGLEVGRCKSWQVTPMGGIDFAIMVANQTRTISPSDGAPGMLRAVGDLKATLPLTACSVKGAEVLFEQNGKPVVWEAKAGQGRIIYAGFSGEYVAAKQHGVEAFMTLLKYAVVDGAGLKWHEPSAWCIERAPYVIGRCLKGECPVEGNLLDVMNPDEPQVENKSHEAGRNFFYKKIK
ncbi:MAG TPA: hypothetical protein PLN69_05080 [bacterium]|nr:hypothetical protein [bacterium]